MADGSTPRKKQVSFRLAPDRVEKLEEYCEEREIRRSDAMRRFVSQGLSDETQGRERNAGRSSDHWVMYLSIIGLVAFMALLFAIPHLL